MTDDTIINLAKQAWQETGEGWTAAAWFSGRLKSFKRFAELVAAEERKSAAAEMERLRTLAATAEKWRGIASAKFGDGRTVQEIQREAAEVEREACAKVCEAWNTAMTDKLADAIRARGAAPKGGE